MNIADQIHSALRAELERQAANGGLEMRALDIPDDRPERPSRVHLEGDVDLDELVMALAGSLAGGP